MRALVIVDAWENYRSNIQIPTVNSEAHSFGGFLNEVCKLERKQGTLIIHSYGENIPMEQIEIRPEDWILDSPKKLKKRIEKDNPNIDEIYFCGFHFGQCIPLQASTGVGDDANIILNLSSLHPLWGNRNAWKHIMKRDSTFHYHLWSQNGIEEISIK